ncbi:MAG: MgtC/SapB family protein [Bacillota bacterium]
MEIIIRLGLAGILGGFIGLERESLRKSAGFRTHILVCMGSTLIMLVSMEMTRLSSNDVDPGRIAAQVVSGIGFLGAGTIMREGVSIRGLTTAASLWVVAGIGLAVGAGLYFAATIGTGMVFLALLYLVRLEKRLGERRNYQIFYLTMDDNPGQLGLVGSVLGTHRTNIQNIILGEASGGRMRVELHLNVPDRASLNDLIGDIIQLPGMHRVERED